MAGKRDPYLRKRVDKRRLLLSWLPRDAKRRRQSALGQFRSTLMEAGDE